MHNTPFNISLLLPNFPIYLHLLEKEALHLFFLQMYTWVFFGHVCSKQIFENGIGNLHEKFWDSTTENKQTKVMEPSSSSATTSQVEIANRRSCRRHNSYRTELPKATFERAGKKEKRLVAVNKHIQQARQARHSTF